MVGGGWAVDRLAVRWRGGRAGAWLGGCAGVWVGGRATSNITTIITVGATSNTYTADTATTPPTPPTRPIKCIIISDESSTVKHFISTLTHVTHIFGVSHTFV